jgi:hypothetical protein
VWQKHTKCSLQAFKRVFTSPSSTDEEQPVDSVTRSAHNRNSGERRTRRDVATLLGMRSVQPRAIAYVSVQVQTIKLDICILY